MHEVKHEVKGIGRHYLTSDWHISHAKICAYTDRKLVTTQEKHDQWLVDTCNKQVLKGDLIYILGDVSFARSKEYTKEILDAINGQKIVILGNHDRAENISWLGEQNSICAYYSYHTIKIQGVPTCLFHYPIQTWDRKHYGSMMLHGHLHGNHSGVQGRILDVGLDSAYNIFGEHRLFKADEVHDMLSKIPFSTSNHAGEQR